MAKMLTKYDNFDVSGFSHFSKNSTALHTTSALHITDSKNKTTNLTTFYIYVNLYISDT